MNMLRYVMHSELSDLVRRSLCSQSVRSRLCDADCGLCADEDRLFQLGSVRVL